MTTKIPACISLDLDNLWSYLKIHGDSSWQGYPSYLDRFVPQVVEFLKKAELTITIFVVGQDAARMKNHEYLQYLVQSGHELGNHSFNHESWLSSFPTERIEYEILKTEEAIHQSTGQRTVGFRGPGFSWSKSLFRVLLENGYRYDASILPTYIGPIARAYYLRKSNLPQAEKHKRAKLFGCFRDGLLPVDAHLLDFANGKKLLEIPVSTMPYFKVPFHLSYLIYLSQYSMSLMKSYIHCIIQLCKMTKTSPSFLLHPLDFLDMNDAPDLGFFPGMAMDKWKKTQVGLYVIEYLRKQFEFMKMSSFAKEIQIKKKLKVVHLT